MLSKTCNSEMCKGWSNHTDFAGRILLGLFFITGGIMKVMDPNSTIAYMSSVGIPMPGFLMWVVALFLILFGAALIVGYKRCLVASSLAAYTLLVSLLFHADFSDPNQIMLLTKNIAIVGGLMVIVGSCKGTCCRSGMEDAGHEHSM